MNLFHKTSRWTSLCAIASLIFACALLTQSVQAAPLKEVVSDDFEKGTGSWEVIGGTWELVKTDNGQSYRMTGKTDYEPKVRSPKIISLVKDLVVGDFEFTAKIQSTAHEAGNHQDMCVFWGFQDPRHFYYVHLGKKADPLACQIFIVNGKPRSKITANGTDGTPWVKDKWHDLKVVRRVADGTIEVYFDDMTKPHMTAKDTTFTWGRIGIGTFDDNGNWDNIIIQGEVVKPKKVRSSSNVSRRS